MVLTWHAAAGVRGVDDAVDDGDTTRKAEVASVPERPEPAPSAADEPASDSAPSRWLHGYAAEAAAVLLPSGRQLDVSLVGWATWRGDVVELRLNGERFKRFRLTQERTGRTVGSVIDGSRVRARCRYRAVELDRLVYPVVGCRVLVDGETAARLVPKVQVRPR